MPAGGARTGHPAARAHAFATELSGISLDLHAGEIVGTSPVSGNGQQELQLAALSGEDVRAERNAIALDGKPVGRLDALPAPPRRPGLRCRKSAPAPRRRPGHEPGGQYPASRTSPRPMCCAA
ncbi:hypothetical protein ACU4GD_41380 [Cupriavidus basilensis]